MKRYIPSLFNYQRRISCEVAIGNTPLGSMHPIRLQSMTNTSTLDTERSVAQSIAIAKAGGEYVRLTAQGIREAENLQQIHALIREKGIQTPLVADIHFNPKAAEAAALYVEKVRVNPGNFVDSKAFSKLEYTDEEYALEIERIREKLLPLLSICKAHDTALRIGVNHGSLSERILSRYGDTPQGMVASCMEFLHICRTDNFHHIVISMKASNVLIMVQSVRLLVRTMTEEGMNYPLHLGVTEAGDGEDGRIKSAVGIGALLSDGIGDTIRVSLSEDPEKEIPVAAKLRDYILKRENHLPISGSEYSSFNPFIYKNRTTHVVRNIGGENLPVVIAPNYDIYTISPDYIWGKCVVPQANYDGTANVHPFYKSNETDALLQSIEPLKFWALTYPELSEKNLRILKENNDIVVLLSSSHTNPVGEMRAFFHQLLSEGCTVPVILHCSYTETNLESLQIKAATDIGTLLIDGFGDGLFLQNEGTITNDQLNAIAFGILQAARARTSKTEYISCPSCGRTLFDLQETIAQIKAETAHLKGLKIAIMGCVVNGPGEMADADYGYVGAAKGKVSLYKKQTCVERNIPAEDAVNKLIALLKSNGDWVEKSDKL